MSKTLGRVRQMPHVYAVDDERAIGNSIIVTLKTGFEFRSDPGCGVQGFDSVKEALSGCSRPAVIKTGVQG